MRCVRPLPDALQTAGPARNNLRGAKIDFMQMPNEWCVQTHSGLTVIPPTPWFSEGSLSLDYPRQNLATCLSSPARVTRPNVGCGTQIMIRLHNQTQPSSPSCIPRCQVCIELRFKSVTSLPRAKPMPISCFSGHFIFSFK